MRKMVKMSMAAVMVMGIGSVSAQAEGTEILSNIKVDGQARARYEMVDKKNATPNANAVTNRLKIGIGADLFGTDWLSAYAEMTDVRALNDNYNSTSNGENHQVVADPEQTRLTQAYLDISLGDPKLRIGRQMINLDNQRFVGAVGWRQMFQTFDAYTLTYNSIENLNLFASYVTQVNTIKADSDLTPSEDTIDTRTLLLNASYKVMDELKVTAYGYLIGENSDNNLDGGSDTYGIALTGNVNAIDGVKLDYRAEYAAQKDPSMEASGFSTPAQDKDANYYNIELNANASGFLVGIQYEVLSGANASGTETAFQTPLATLHAHNGYGDIFLTTPDEGLEDLNFTLGYKSKEFGTLKAIYHDFSSEVGSIDYGNELDIIYTRAVPNVNNLTGTLKFVKYDADDVTGSSNVTTNVDMTKFVAMLDYKFSTK
ncbi:MAG: alginate export family protein [Sulfurimonas sp.]|uniref:alginate export family protein n=1 Tax=Sulfurimonas sp. TaxID=2022749 RepID=UPI0025F30810|nr:alginate export family protein [Sulfurimonas sp.]MCK9454507.1 alginate export family protein [Sulfurimonas sp.]